MRERIGNFHSEGHGRALRHYEFVADGSKGAREIEDAVMTATGLDFRGSSGVQHGYINTSRRPDGSVHVAIVLYESCDTPACEATPINLETGKRSGHPRYVRAADLIPSVQAAVKMTTGEHQKHRLTGGAQDAKVLADLGWEEDERGRKRPLGGASR